jgi:hypothetical protein
MKQTDPKSRKSSPGSLLSRALERASALSPVKIEVMISRKSSDLGFSYLSKLIWGQKILKDDQVLIYANPRTHCAALWCGPAVARKLPKERELQEWIAALEEDLHQTHPDRALALAVMSLALVLSESP